MNMANIATMITKVMKATITMITRAMIMNRNTTMITTTAKKKNSRCAASFSKCRRLT